MSALMEINALVIHHSASSRVVEAAEIRQWHLDKGWDDVGYHWLIEEDGTIVQGRPMNVMGAHARGRNSDTVGLCIIGDNTNTNQTWTACQLHSAATLMDAIRLLIPGIEIVGHRDIMDPGHTVCPGVDVATTWPFNRD